MAYQAKRKKQYKEELHLTEEDGTVVHILQVLLDPDGMAQKLSEKHIALVNALQGMNTAEKPDEKMEAIENTVMDLLEAVFGEQDAAVIIEFYEKRYIEMCQEVLPFITDVVIPNVRKMAKGNKKAVLSGYNQKRRRMLGRR